MVGSSRITCKHCQASIALCGHIAADLVSLAGVREENARLRAELEDILDNVRDPDRAGRGLGPDRPFAYSLPPPAAKVLLRRIRAALAK